MSNPHRTEGSEPGNTSHSRASSTSTRSSLAPTAQGHPHAPQTPSRLRQAHAPGSSPAAEPPIHQYTSLSSSPPPGNSPIQDSPLRSSSPPLGFDSRGIYPELQSGGGPAEDLEATRVHGQVVADHSRTAADESTRLLENYNHMHAGCGGSTCSHGTFSPQAQSFQEREGSVLEGRYAGEEEPNGYSSDAARRRLGNDTTERFLNVRQTRPKLDRWESWMSWRGTTNSKGMSTTKWLTETYGIRGKRKMYLSYYIPFLNCKLYYEYCS